MTGPFGKPEKRIETFCPLVLKIREEVDKWRDSDYEGASETTKLLLNFWFKEDHMINEKLFKYYFCQREAIETLIFLYEVKKIKTLRDLVINYDTNKKVAYNPHEDLFAKFCFKMATGSGKTKVMTLAIVWSFFNNIIEQNKDFSKNFLIIAPNIAVYERLRTDFEGGKIFKTDPLIPFELQNYWDVDVVLEDEMTSRSSKGRIYLTNVQKLYERSNDNENLNPVEVIVGSKPREKTAYETIFDDLMSVENISLINDEAHHVWDPESKWSEFIIKLFNRFKKDEKNFSFQLDFSATPKKQNGGLFEWVITDYPLADAIKNGIVKRPIIGEVENAKETPSERADVVYRDYIEGGIRRWRRYREAMQKVKKNPIIFFMATKTTEAEDIRDFLETKADFKGKVLMIHTNLKGEISDKEWTKLKEESRNLDSDTDKYRAVVSVLMLREGWDVKNVNVVVGLRPYTSKANILPEQSLGRGLRLMFGPESGFEETVDVFGSKAFIDFIDSELKKEGVRIQRLKEKDMPDVTNIFVDPEKTKFDIEIPSITPKYTRINRSFDDIKVENLPKGPFELDLKSYSIRKIAKGRDALTNKQVWKYQWNQPIPENFESIVGYYSNRILRECKIPSRNYEFIPKLKEYIVKRLFGRELTEEEMNNKLFLRQFIESNIYSYLITLFPRVINTLTIIPQEVKLNKEPKKASHITPFLTRKEVYKPKKCLLNLVPVDNDLEGRFCIFLDSANDVKKFIKNDVNLNFYIEYVNRNKGISYYIPDFIIETNSGFFVVETKGAEMDDVELKDKRTKEWCEDTSKLTDKKWKYLKVKQIIFDENQNIKTFSKLVELIEAYQLATNY
jgi:type III restriction enzyme